MAEEKKKGFSFTSREKKRIYLGLVIYPANDNRLGGFKYYTDYQHHLSKLL